MPKRNNKGKELSEEKKTILDLLYTVKSGKIPLTEAHVIWEKMTSYRSQYYKRHGSQSWNSFMGGIFEELIFWILKTYVSQVSKKEEFKHLSVLTDSELKKNDYLFKKISVRYGEDQTVLPDTDMAIVDFDSFDPWASEVIAIISCKTSLRERIAQACYWKLKLLSSDTTKNVRVFLATSDNDKDFILKKNGKKSRDRIIAEYELDGIYILRGDFKHEWESSRVKQYEKIFEDLGQIFKGIKRCN
jgi:type II restriction enzyme